MFELAAVLVLLKFTAPPSISVGLICAVPAELELLKVRTDMPLNSKIALPAVEELLKVVVAVPVIVMVEVPAVALLLKVIVPPEALVMFALAAVVESKKSIWPLLVKAALPAELVLENSAKP